MISTSTQAISIRFCNLFPPKHPFPAKKHRPALEKTRRNVFITTPETQLLPTLPADVVDKSVASFWDYQFLFASQRSETVAPVTLRTIEGAIPDDFPSGTYYLAGPGIFSDDHGSTVHPLDGHGYLRAFTFNGSTGEVTFSAKYVETEAQIEEHDRETGKWRFTHRGPFSVLRGGKKIGNTKVMKNVANTSVLKWGGRLLCLWEGGDPYEVESTTLDTIGRFDVVMNGLDSFQENSSTRYDVMDDRVSGGIWDVAAQLLRPILFGVFKMSPKRLLSHYKIDPRRNRLLLVTCNAEDMLLPRSTFTFYEFDLNFKLLQKQDFKIPDHVMIHDWAFTDTHYILFGNRIKLDFPGSMVAMSGFSPMISALTVNPSRPTSPIYMLPRDGPSCCNVKNRSSEGSEWDWKVPIEVPTQMWLLHTGNAFEQRDQEGHLQEVQIHASACSYQWFNFHKMFGYNWKSGKLDPSFMNKRIGDEGLLPHLVKVSINFGAGGKSRKCSVEPLTHWRRPADFPTINPIVSGSKNTYIYAATCSGLNDNLPHFPFDTVAKFNVTNGSSSTWSTGNRRFIGEPMFIPKGGTEDDGYLVIVEYAVSIKRCYLVVLDPARIGEGDALIARVEVPKNLSFPMGFHGFWAVNH